MKSQLYLVKNGVPFDIAFSIAQKKASAYSRLLYQAEKEHIMNQHQIKLVQTFFTNTLEGRRSKETWVPDITDWRIVDELKARFIYDVAEKLLGETLTAADDLLATASKAFGVFLAVSFVSAGYLMTKCDFITHVCHSELHGFYPCLIATTGFLTASMIALCGSLWPRHYHFRGNEPKNLLQNDLCKMDLALIIASSAVSMQSRIEHNAKNTQRIGFSLRLAYLIAGATLLLALTSA